MIVINCNYSELRRFSKNANERGLPMINESYAEVLVKRKESPVIRIGQIVSALLAAFFLFMAVIGYWLGILAALALGAACYVLTMYSSIEYEYTYVDKELQIDRILGRTQRKRMETLDLNQMEAMGPMSAWQMDNYRKRQSRVLNYGSKGGNEAGEYHLIFNDKHVIIEPTEEMVKMIQAVFPRKVFTK
jgi:hypothetical protein